MAWCYQKGIRQLYFKNQRNIIHFRLENIESYGASNTLQLTLFISAGYTFYMQKESTASPAADQKSIQQEIKQLSNRDWLGFVLANLNLEAIDSIPYL